MIRNRWRTPPSSQPYVPTYNPKGKTVLDLARGFMCFVFVVVGGIAWLAGDFRSAIVFLLFALVVKP
jgi:hypothetical protein